MGSGNNKSELLKSNRGMLPENDPVLLLPRPLDGYDKLARNLPELIRNKTLISKLHRLDEEEGHLLLTCLKKADPDQLKRGYSILATLRQAYGYVHCLDSNQQPVFPKQFLSALEFAANQLSIAPTQTYFSYILYNWHLKKPKKGITLENVSPILTFTGTEDEKGFIKIHIVCEALAAQAVKNAIAINLFLQQKKDAACTQKEIPWLQEMLEGIAVSIQSVAQILPQLSQICEPKVYAYIVRPHLMPVEAFRGASGAQTSFLRIMDDLLGILSDKLDMQNYRSREDRAIIDQFSANSLAATLQNNPDPALLNARKVAVSAVLSFRQAHIDFIYKDYQAAFPPDNQVGTGKTIASKFLGGNLDATRTKLTGSCPFSSKL